MIDKTIDWLKAEYESIFEDGSGEMKVHRGKVHKYLGMSLDFLNKGQCIVTMNDYVCVCVCVDLASGGLGSFARGISRRCPIDSFPPPPRHFAY